MEERLKRQKGKTCHALRDSVPVKLKRTVSEISKKWLFDHDVIESRSLSENEIWSSRNILDLDLGATLVDMRQVLFDLIRSLKANEHQQRQLKAIVNDSLAAHEMGQANYFGHFATYCDRRWAFPVNLLIQQELYEDTYMLPALGPEKLASEIGTLLCGNIQKLTNSEWLAEMLALVSEKKRLKEHSLTQWKDQLVSDFIAKRIARIDYVSQELSNYEIAKLAASRLEKKFGNRVGDVLLGLRQNQAAEIRRGVLRHLTTSHFPNFDGSEKMVMSFRGTSDVGLFAVDPEEIVLQLLDAESAEQNNRTSISRADLLGGQVRALEGRSGTDEFPEIRAMRVGELWLALHSIVRLQWLSENAGMSVVYMEKNSRQVCSPKAQKLALELLHFRNEVLSTCVQLASGEQNMLLNSLLEFMHGKTSLRELNAQREATPGPKYQIEMLEHRDRSLEIQSKLKRYYQENKKRIDQQIRHPEDFFSKIV